MIKNGGKYNKGFTIIELLIVIIVIGILAAIVIIAYNGITTRANSSSAQSTVEQINKKILAYIALNNDQVPPDLTTAGVQSPNNGANYQYTTNTLVSPQQFCITTTIGNASYYVNNSSQTTPSVGACPITNLVINPSLENNVATNWGAYSDQGSVSTSIVSGGAYDRNYFFRMNVTSGTNGNGGIYFLNSPAIPGQTYTATVHLKSNGNKSMFAGLEWRDSSNTQLPRNTGVPISVGSTWTTISVTATAPANAAYVEVLGYSNGGALNSGDIIDGDAYMLTQGSTVYNYADGNKPGWTWNGAADNSTSRGAPL